MKDIVTGVIKDVNESRMRKCETVVRHIVEEIIVKREHIEELKTEIKSLQERLSELQEPESVTTEVIYEC